MDHLYSLPSRPVIVSAMATLPSLGRRKPYNALGRAPSRLALNCHPTSCLCPWAQSSYWQPALYALPMLGARHGTQRQCGLSLWVDTDVPMLVAFRVFFFRNMIAPGLPSIWHFIKGLAFWNVGLILRYSSGMAIKVGRWPLGVQVVMCLW